MKFMVSRTSQSSWDAGSPCPGAYRDTYTRIDERAVNDPAKVRVHEGETDWWYREGENHRLSQKTRGRIQRDFPNQQGWFIDLETLDDLMRLHRQTTDLVIGTALDNPAIPSIEIYDTWRE